MTKETKTETIKDKDFSLIQAINSGNGQKFHELVERYEKRLYNFGLKMCGNVHDAEDLVQDTFLNVFRYLKDFRYETKFKNWLYRIATTSCIKKRRKSKFAPDKELSLEEFLPKDEASVPNSLPSWAHHPLESVLNHELSSVIKKAIVALPESYKVVFVLRDIEGFNTEEAAQILNLSSSNIKVRLHRARLFLRERLKKYFDNEF